MGKKEKERRKKEENDVRERIRKNKEDKNIVKKEKVIKLNKN